MAILSGKASPFAESLGILARLAFCERQPFMLFPNVDSITMQDGAGGAGMGRA
jgi:hypothetical protein